MKIDDIIQYVGLWLTDTVEMEGKPKTNPNAVGGYCRVEWNDHVQNNPICDDVKLVFFKISFLFSPNFVASYPFE